jgi:hypothetical protein
MNSSNEEYDDLRRIKFIKEATEQWLRDRLQVRTYRDLAKLSVDEIEQQRKADGKSVPSRSNIEAFIAEAAVLADEAEEEEEEEEEKEKEEAVAEVAAPAEPVASEPADSPKKDGDWKDYASFMVYFEAREVEGKEEKRIKVHHLEKDKSKEFPGITPDHFLWMLEQAGESLTALKVPEPEKWEPSKPEPEEERPVIEPEKEAEVNITEIRVFQPPKAKKPLASSAAGQPLQKELSAGKPFALEVLISLGGEAAQSVANKNATYRARIIANEIDTKEGIHLGDTEPEAFVEGTLDYSVKSPEATLEAGEYGLWVLVTVQAANVLPNFLVIPLIKLV